MKIFRYLKGRSNCGLRFKKINLDVYVDSVYKGDEETRKLTTGFIIKMGTELTSWYSILQLCVSVSIAKSEYYGIYKGSK